MIHLDLNTGNDNQLLSQFIILFTSLGFSNEQPVNMNKPSTVLGKYISIQPYQSTSIFNISLIIFALDLGQESYLIMFSESRHKRHAS